jgi:hypothetical protein
MGGQTMKKIKITTKVEGYPARWGRPGKEGKLVELPHGEYVMLGLISDKVTAATLDYHKANYVLLAPWLGKDASVKYMYYVPRGQLKA